MVSLTTSPLRARAAVVQIAHGALRGRVVDGVASFKGIPYAAPPLGDLRWREPQPPEPWEGYREALEFGSDCVQAAGSLEDIRTTPSEDCLYLNVWKPAAAARGADLPVMVWIHGGGYVGGGSSIPTYDGSAFARHGIVVVTFNYRLGRLGFFAHPALIAAAEGPVGNYGYMDQIQALRWVRDNIDEFGGDPDQVTLVGESAGGGSVLHLLTSPVVGDLFHRVVVMSGGGREAILSRPLSEGTLHDVAASTIDAAFGLAHGVVGDSSRALEHLRRLPPRVVAGGENLETLAKLKLFGGPLPGVPVIDGTIVVGQPEDHFLSGHARHLPTLIGTTALDVPLQFPPSKVHPLEWFGEEEAAAHEAYGVPDQRRLDPESLLRLLLRVGADMTMHEPAHFVAASMRRAGRRAWLYRFTYTAGSTRPEQKAQSHAGEVPFMFDTLASRYGDAVTGDDQATATAFNEYVANFVATGDPNGDGLPEWPQVVPSVYDVLDFSLDDGPVFGPDPRAGVALVGRARKAQREP